MGTGASSYSPPPTPLRSSLCALRTSAPKDGDLSSIDRSNHLTRTDNHVGPVIIKNCMEEYQHVVDSSEPIVLGCLADRLPKHPLIKGEYFLVRDHELADGNSPKSIGLLQAKSWAPVYWCGQPTARELSSIVKALENESYSEILLFNMREEPVLFLNLADDFVPYTIKPRHNLRDCVLTGRVMKEADLFEATIRHNVIALATNEDDNQFYFYNDTTSLIGEPHVYPVQFEDNLLVSEEVYSRLAFSNPKLRYRRLCFPLYAAPPDLEVDHFISIAQDSPLFTRDYGQPAMLFTCESEAGRANVGAVMGYLLLTHRDMEANQRRPSSVTSRLNRLSIDQMQEQGFFWAVQKLVAAIKDGLNIKHQVDMAIDNCCTSLNIRSVIYETKKAMEALPEQKPLNPSVIEEQYTLCCDYLSRYMFLICFNAYLADQYEVHFRLGFSKWMSRHPKLNHIRCIMALPVYNTSLSLLSSGRHCLVSDNYVGLDLLGSQMDVRVANFRKINIKSIPVYGMAQPTSDGLSKVVNHLLNMKVRHTHVVVVNLRNDVIIELDRATYSVRDADKKDEPIIFPGFSRTELEDSEEGLKKNIRRQKTFQLYNELCDPCVEREILSAYTVLDLAENQRLQTLDMTYIRVPLMCEESPTEKDIDALKDVVCNHCKEEKLKNNTDVAFVFFCRTGKSRSTFAMAIAGLIMCHQKGFTKGSQKGEQERISLPNAQYTKGDFIIVQKLVRMLPDGHQMKREVDFILDEIFNTMTPMMFHMREIIFVTYNRWRKSTRADRDRILCQSILYLERYVYVILFNTYLHAEKAQGWTRPFSDWMRVVGARAGVYEVLDNLGFYDFEDTLTDYRKMSVRWRYPVPNILWQGEFR